ncbi:MAG: tRNA lysidine(34) synthetase TilS [Variibacter sp.]
MRAAKPAPISPQRAALLFKSFGSYPSLLVAVSGGADSSALLFLLARWRAERRDGPRLAVATVDHGLRAQSRAEAEAVKRQARTLGLPHRTLRWVGEKPATRIQEAARAARYALLMKEARRVGVAHIALAHTLDDQAETVLLRLAAGSGPAGLTGMRPTEMRDGVTLCRPLLSVRKAELVATLQAAEIAWSEDPSNADPRFARPRLRAAADALAREGLTPERLARLAERLRRHEEAVAAGAADVQAKLRHGRYPDRLDGAALIAAPEELALRVLSAAIAAVGGGNLPRLGRLEALWQDMRAAIAGGRRLRRTLAEALISVDRDASVAIGRAPARRPRSQARVSPDSPEMA